MKLQQDPENIQDSRPRILIIDDDPDVRALLTRYLNRDYSILTGKNGEEGLALAAQYHPSIIVCDWMMPGISGIEVCQKVRSDPKLIATYFILLTAWGDTDEKVFALETGADDFIQKPPNLKEFQARIRAGLRIYQLNQALQEKQRTIELDLTRARTYILSQIPPPFEGLADNVRVSIDWNYLPSSQLGGDIFNFQWMPDGRLAVYLLDVAGHGIGAALLSVAVMHMLRTIPTDSPMEVMNLLNRSFTMEKQNNLFFTIWFGIIDFKKLSIRYSCAGHPPALLLYNGGREALSLKTTGIPIGMMPDSHSEEAEIDIDRACTLTLYSDGIYERIHLPDEKDPDFLEDWIQRVSRQPSNSAPFSTRKNIDWLLESAAIANQGMKFEDDVTIIQIGMEPAKKS